MIRPADPDRDAAAIAAIYAPFVHERATTFDEPPAPSAAAFAHKIVTYAATHAFLVAERDGRVAGYAYANPHRDRAAYRWAAEVSVYVDPAFHRQGVGRELYTELLTRVRARGLRTALAGITLPNAGSVALHESLGFEPVGVYRAIGWKLGAWHDVGWWQLLLVQPGDELPPAEPG